ncbi:super-infection exclusion protein B [Providencia sp.]|uniref:super-infection exclusion protein B n=1 Tax=Providencia sp. TaxID=589 RepID=UPI003F954917
MPNWIEAALAYLKLNTSLRFNMFWLVSFVLILAYMPNSFIELLNANLKGNEYPNILPILFSIGVSFFISYFIKQICRVLSYFYHLMKSKMSNSKYKIKVSRLNEKEIMVIAIFAALGLTTKMKYDSLKNPEILSLIKKGVIRPVKGDHFNSPECRYEISPNFIEPIKFNLIYNEKIRKFYEQLR